MAINAGIENLVRPEVIALGGYVASKSPEVLMQEIGMRQEDIIKLDGNENLYGCSPRVNQALATYPYLNIYPDAGQEELKDLLSGYTGVSPENIVASNGSDELIGYVVRMFVGRGDEAVNCVPTFDIFRHRTQLCGGTLVEILRDDNFAVDVKAVKAAITDKTKMLFLATPNNPTGTLTPQEDIFELAETGLPFLVDEAYAEFSGETVASYVSQYPNMMVFRTFSKWAGLAGIRIGYGIFAPKIANYIMTVKEPYNVNVAALVAVRESFKDLDYLKNNVKAIVKERERLYTELEKLPLVKPFPSRANFIYCSVLQGNASELQKRLERKGILIRYFDIPLLQNALRIGVGKPEHTDAVIKNLKQAMEEMGG